MDIMIMKIFLNFYVMLKAKCVILIIMLFTMKLLDQLYIYI